MDFFSHKYCSSEEDLLRFNTCTLYDFGPAPHQRAVNFNKDTPPSPFVGLEKKDVSMLGDSFFIFGPAHEAPRMLQLVMKFKIYIPPIIRMLHTKMVTICCEEEVKKMLKNDDP